MIPLSGRIDKYRRIMEKKEKAEIWRFIMIRELDYFLEAFE